MKIEATATQPTNSTATVANLKDAAKQFESMLIAQMLKSARETDAGGWTGESDQSNASVMEMAEQHLADLLAAQGGLGIGKMALNQLQKK